MRLSGTTASLPSYTQIFSINTLKALSDEIHVFRTFSQPWYICVYRYIHPNRHSYDAFLTIYILFLLYAVLLNIRTGYKNILLGLRQGAHDSIFTKFQYASSFSYRSHFSNFFLTLFLFLILSLSISEKGRGCGRLL